MAPAIVIFFCPSSFCLRCVKCQESFSSSSRIALPHTEPATLLNFLSRKCQRLFPQINGCLTAPISSQFITRSVVSSSSVSTSRVHSVDELKQQRLLHVWHRLAWHRTMHHWQCNWRMARASSSLRAVQGRTSCAAVVTVLITLEPGTFQLVSKPIVSGF